MRFDLDAYTAHSAPVAVDDLDFDEFGRTPLSEPTLRCIRYMHDVEHHTICYLRDLLLTPAHADPRVTTFLTMWCYEEFWHGEALGAVLAAHGEPSGADRLSPVRRRDQRPRPWSAAISLLGSRPIASEMTALHMTWGAVNEWTTQTAYARLLAREPHPVLGELLRRLMRQEGRHIDFYASEATTRLQGSRRAQRLARLALARFWRPVGTNVMPAEESGFLAAWLFGGGDGLDAARRVDRRIDRLPGLDGLRLLERARARSGSHDNRSLNGLPP